jgi:hypothetical protein
VREGEKRPAWAELEGENEEGKKKKGEWAGLN